MSDQLRLDGMDVPVDPEARWSALADEKIRELAGAGPPPFTSEDVTAGLGLPAGEVEMNANNAVGAAIERARRRGLITRVGDTPARRPSQHGARIGLWIGSRWR